MNNKTKRVPIHRPARAQLTPEIIESWKVVRGAVDADDDARREARFRIWEHFHPQVRGWLGFSPCNVVDEDEPREGFAFVGAWHRAKKIQVLLDQALDEKGVSIVDTPGGAA